MRMREEGLNLEDLRAHGLLSTGPAEAIKKFKFHICVFKCPSDCRDLEGCHGYRREARELDS